MEHIACARHCIEHASLMKSKLLALQIWVFLLSKLLSRRIHHREDSTWQSWDSNLHHQHRWFPSVSITYPTPSLISFLLFCFLHHGQDKGAMHVFIRRWWAKKMWRLSNYRQRLAIKRIKSCHMRQHGY